MNYAPGNLVKTRGREWVVLTPPEDDLLLLRPLGGSDDEIAGIYLPLEKVESARFDLPDPSLVGDHRSCRYLRDAIRLGFRSGTGPFRSFARLAVAPRPYQIVPLLMALRLDPIRLLIADDVGIGKTIEACLVGRELLDRGEVSRLAVLCPPHLAEQWQIELQTKFNIDAKVVLPSTARGLERHCRVGESLFDIHPHVIVSMDFIKSDRRRDEFSRTCPEFVIVDEAHTCAYGYEGRKGRHQRHQLVKQLSNDPSRHLILVTATPHSGKEEAFRSLLLLLNPAFADLPPDLSGPENAPHRRLLAAQFVQRRRGDIRHFMRTETPFPNREEAEATYQLSADYRKFLDRVLAYTRETVRGGGGDGFGRRVRWWSALSLLRSVSSSPAAAVDTLHNRAPSAGAETEEEADEIGRRAVLDLAGEEQVEGVDITPGSDFAGEDEGSSATRRRLLDLARAAEQLKGEKDAKLIFAVAQVKKFVQEGYRPILFCRFIPTAEYLAAQLRKRLPSTIEVVSVTGKLPPAEREARVLKLAQSPKRVLVCTECLSEGINLQEHFDAVIHYDLSWNPTRHEQREGRVDRFGQPRRKVRILTYYGIDNPIDGIVLDVLIRKHKKIRGSLGISVPVPVDTDAIVEAIFEGLLFREQSGTTQELLPGLEEYLRPSKEALYAGWEDAAAREKRSRTMYAQEGLSRNAEEVARELEETRAAIGSPEEVVDFTLSALREHGAVIRPEGEAYQFDLAAVPRALRDQAAAGEKFAARFELPVEEGTIYLNRTHPLVEGLASYVLDTALDPESKSIARRAGAIRTRAVATRTTVLLTRFRYDISAPGPDEGKSQLAEECLLFAFQGSPASARWLDPAAAEELLSAQPAANIFPEQAADFVRQVVEGYDHLRPHLEEEAARRARVLLESHTRVRAASRRTPGKTQVKPQLPPDILGIYVYLPANK